MIVLPFRLSWNDLKDPLIYAVRTWLTSIIAFWIACKLQLDSPQWTFLTVWIVAQPTTGMLLSKALYRLFGTIAGCVIGLGLIVAFAQTPELFVLALALLMGGCTLAANLLTNFRAYAAVLAGYTAAIVSLDAIQQPEAIFNIAMARGACIVLAIICSIVSASLFAPHRAAAQATLGLRNAIAEAARRAAFPWDGDHDQRLHMGKNLLEHLIGLHTLVEYASSEAARFRVHRSEANSLLAHLFGVISAKRSLDAHVLRSGMPSNPEVVHARDEIFRFLETLPQEIERGTAIDLVRKADALRSHLVMIDPESLPISLPELTSRRVIIDRLDDILRELNGALEDWLDLQGLGRRRDRLPLNFHRDHRAALINGFRAALAVGGLGAFWIASAWSSGPGALVILAVIVSLFSSFPHPDRVGWAFFEGSLVACAAAFVAKFFLLNHVADYEVAAVVFGLFLIPVGILGYFPKTAIYSAAFPIVFLSQVGPANPMTYNIVDFFNLGVATLAGVMAGSLAYQVVFPPDPAAARRYVIGRIRLSLESIAQCQRPSFYGWTTRMYDRILRLHDPENPSAITTNEWLEVGLGSINLGCEIFRVRHLLDQDQLPAQLRAALETVRSGFDRFHRDPDHAATLARRALNELGNLEPDSSPHARLLWARGRGTLEEIIGCFEQPWTLLNRTTLTG